MMTHVSVRSSEVHVRTKPALRLCPRPLQKSVWTFLQSKNIPPALENGLRSNGAGALSTRGFYAWRRLSHLRSSFLYLEEGQPVVMIPPHSKEGDKAWTLRIPVNHRALSQVGPVVCECYWDAVDHDLIICDVIYYNNMMVWETEDFTERYQRLVDIVQGGILQPTHEYSDCVVSLPQYETLATAARWSMDDDAFCVVFQPEDCRMRRFRWTRERKERGIGANSAKEEKPNYMSVVGKKVQQLPTPPPLVKAAVPVAKMEMTAPTILSDSEDESGASTTYIPIVSKPGVPTDGIIVCSLRLDTKNPLPDSYILEGPNGADYGVAAVRSLFISLELREKLKSKDSVKVQVAWYEPFRKYEVLSLKD